MNLTTRSFGEIKIANDDIINFKEGLPGFPDDKRFVLLTEPGNSIAFLQSVDDGETSFVMVDMVGVMPDYNPHVDECLIEDLGKYEPTNFLIYNIVTVNEDLKDSTVNLKAPIIINAAEKKGKQIVCENDYSVKAPLFDNNEQLSEEEGKKC